MGKLIVLPGNKITASGPRLVVTAEKMAEIRNSLERIQKLLDELIIMSMNKKLDKYPYDK